MTDISERKSTLRRELRSAVAAMTPAERNAAAARLVEHIRARPAWRAARTVMLFVALPDEPNLLPLIDEAIGHRKTVLLPRFVAEEAAYEPARVENLTVDLVAGRYGVAEPAAHCPKYTVKSLDVALVPGLGFDPVGRRLGRGKGYYDRLLVNATGGLWGVGFDCQLLPELPAEPHDVVLNCIVTPSRWVEVVPRAVE